MAKLKSIIDNLVEVPGNMREFYTARGDGKWEVSLDGEPSGFVAAEKLAEFRDGNRALNAKLKAFDGIDPATVTATAAKLADLEKKFDGVDPEEYRALKAKPDVSKRVT